MFEDEVEFAIISNDGKQAAIKAPYRLRWLLEGLRCARDGVFQNGLKELDWGGDALVYATALTDAGVISEEQLWLIREFNRGQARIEGCDFTERSYRTN